MIVKKAKLCVGDLTNAYQDQCPDLAERPNGRTAERPNRPIWNCPLFDGTIIKYYQNYGRY